MLMAGSILLVGLVGVGGSGPSLDDIRANGLLEPISLKDMLMLDPNATSEPLVSAENSLTCSDANGSACLSYSGDMAAAFSALANAAQCGPNHALYKWSCAECRQVGFDLWPNTLHLITGREIFQGQSTSLFVAKVQGSFPGSQPRQAEPLKHAGEECLANCRVAGYCQWCGVGNACCKHGDLFAPTECLLMTAYNASSQYQCVSQHSLAQRDPSPTPGSPSPTAGGRTSVTESVNTSGAEVSSSSWSPFGCVLAVRGSQNADNWIMNFLFFLVDMKLGEQCPGCRANLGWLQIWHEIEGKVMTALLDLGCVPGGEYGNLLITGHSLGAAVATLGMFHMQAKGYNVVQSFVFESPRVGNTKWSQAFQNFFGRAVPVYRVTHSHDTVPRVPPQLGFLHMDLDFRHVASEVFFPSTDRNNYKVCDDPESILCGDRYIWLYCLIRDSMTKFSSHCQGPFGPHQSWCWCPVTMLAPRLGGAFVV